MAKWYEKTSNPVVDSITSAAKGSTRPQDAAYQPVKGIKHGVQGAKEGDLGKATYGGAVEGLPGGTAFGNYAGNRIQVGKDAVQQNTRSQAGDIIFRGGMGTLKELEAKYGPELAKKLAGLFDQGGGVDPGTTVIPTVGGVGGGAGGSFGTGGQQATIGALTEDQKGLLANQEFRTSQQDLIKQLAAQARGEGPSLATEQLKQSQQANVAAQMAALASARGGANPAMARQTMQSAQQIQAQTARDAALARIQEQMGAREQLGQVSAQAREQDLGYAQQQQALAVQQAQLQQAYQDNLVKYSQQGLDAQRANQLAAIETEKLRQGWYRMPQPMSPLEQGINAFASLYGMGRS